MSEASDGFSVSHWLEILTTTQTADRQWKEAVKSLTEMGLRAVPVLIEAMYRRRKIITKDRISSSVTAASRTGSLLVGEEMLPTDLIEPGPSFMKAESQSSI